jgi:hypothetical protein
LIITSGTQIIRYFKNFTITQVFSACPRAITLQAAQIGEPAQPIDVQEFKPQASDVQAAVTPQDSDINLGKSLKLSRVETIAILYGTLSIKTDNIADHIVSISKSKLSLPHVISTS